jgi:O-antigen/teichoic acid export membrane protein
MRTHHEHKIPVTSRITVEQVDEAGTRQALVRIGRMGVLFMGSNLVRGAAAFVTSLVIARTLGPDTFGRWTLCVTWASMLTFLLDLGFGVLLTRDVAAGTARAGAMVGGALAARMTLFVPVATLFLATAPALGLRGEAASVLWTVLLLAASGMAYGAVAAVFRAWPATLTAIVIVEVTGALLQLGGTWWVTRQHGGVSALLLLASAVQIAQISAAALLWRVVADAGPVFERPSLRSAVSLVRRAFPFTLAGLVANVQERLAPLMLGRLSGIGEVALFGAAWRIGSIVRMLPQAMFGGALPVLAATARQEGSENVAFRFERVLSISAGIAATGLAVFAGPVLRLTYGADYAPGALTLIWVAIGLWPFLINSARKVSLYAVGQERLAVRWSAVALAIQVVACVLLIPRYGSAGAALAMAVGEVAVWWPLRAVVTHSMKT